MESIYYLFVYLFAVWFLSISSVLPMRDEIIWCRWYLDFFAAVPILNKGRVNYCCWRYQVSPNCSSSSNWSRNNLNWEQVAISTYENGGVWILVGAQLGYTPCFKSIFFFSFLDLFVSSLLGAMLIFSVTFQFYWMSPRRWVYFDL